MIIDSVSVNDDESQNSAMPTDWQQGLRDMIRTPEALLQALDLPEHLLPAAQQGHQLFPIRVTRAFLQRIRPADPDDPLLRQILPLSFEMEASPQGYGKDPLAEDQAIATPGLLHKYQSRVLTIGTSACAIHCRYCFRRHFPYADQRQSQDDFKQKLEYIRHHPDVNEVILSGGDPLMLTDAQLLRQMEALATLPQIRTVRIHTRLPVVLPQRVTEGLLEALKRFPHRQVMVIHCNHPQELDTDVRQALRRLRSVTTLLNQTVLLRGVNDSEAVLTGLSEALFDAGVLPYYLHQMDRVEATHHFAVPDEVALHLHQTLTRNLPGYLVPRLVREEPGAPSKTLLLRP